MILFTAQLTIFIKIELLRAIKKYGMEKENVIYVGDEIRDIKAAMEAGIKVASVTWGYNFENVLSKYKPDFIINRPEDLLNLFK